MTIASHLRRATRTAIPLAELRARSDDPDLALVDTRPVAAYNGWRLGGEPRGGHIPGAASLPEGWLDRLDDGDLLRLLASKAITRERAVVAYGSGPADGRVLAERLAGLGFGDVRRLRDGWAAWSADPTLPVDRLAGFERLVHPGWLRDALDGRSPKAAPAGHPLVFHVDAGPPDDHAAGHIPGAWHLDTNRLEAPAEWNRRSPAQLARALGALGITHDSTVILYGRDASSDGDGRHASGDGATRAPGRHDGQVAAARAALILRYAGVDDVRLLDGGLEAWVRDGRPLDTGTRDPRPVASFGVAIPRRPELFVDIEEAKAILADRGGSALVSVRTRREQAGLESGYEYVDRVGRIAGDVWGNGGADGGADGGELVRPYRSIDNTMRPYPEIASGWARAGITPDKRVAFYCGTGWRAAEAWLCADLMGWPRAAVYDGGWLEWSRDPERNPIETGEAEGNH